MEFRIEKASADDYLLFADIIQKVWEGMEEKSWFMADNADYTRRMLSTGMGIGYKAIETESGNTAGVFLAVIPGTDKSNLGRDAEMPDSLLPFIAHMDSAAVLPEYRGCGLQKRLMTAAEEDLKAMGMRYLMCTVHPDNRFSLNNVLRQGYKIVTVKEKYGGNIRAILQKELTSM